MPLNYPESGTDNSKFLAPAGGHIGLCNMVIDLGIQPGSKSFPEPKPQVLIGWELPFEEYEYEKDGKQIKGKRTVMKTYTASMHEKAALRKDLEGWRGKAFSKGEAASFDVGKVLSIGCFLNIIHKSNGDRTFANVASVSGVPKGTTLPGFSTKPLYYGPDDKTLYDELPEWIRKKIDGQIVPEAVKEISAQHDELPEWIRKISPFEEEDSDAVPF